MTNLTITLDETIVKKARVRAIQEGTSVSAKVREFLTSYAQGDNSQLTAALAFIEGAQRSQAGSEGIPWSRDELYDRPYPGPAGSAA